MLIVHGMGGRPTSHYCMRAARAAERAGYSSLRVALRGADRQGQDFYHAGLTADLRAALGSEVALAHETIFVLGYSLGGHVTLRLAVESSVPTVRAAAAVCAPLDLVSSARALDEDVPRFYRDYLLAGLKGIYAEVARRREVPTPVARVRKARSIREWDELAVVPRHGFASVDAYYRGESVAPLLKDLPVPALLVASESDPMVPLRTLREAMGSGAPALEVRTVRGGGHVAFPRGIDLDLGVRAAASRGLEDQLMGWFARHA